MMYNLGSLPLQTDINTMLMNIIMHISLYIYSCFLVILFDICLELKLSAKKELIFLRLLKHIKLSYPKGGILALLATVRDSFYMHFTSMKIYACLKKSKLFLKTHKKSYGLIFVFLLPVVLTSFQVFIINFYF